MSNIEKMPDSREADARRRKKAAYQELRERNSAKDGQIAWDAYAHPEKGREKLEPHECKVIAQNLWEELERYKEKLESYQNQNGKLQDLYDDINRKESPKDGVPPNIKDKVTLQPGKASHRKALKTTFLWYRWFIEALARKAASAQQTDENQEKYLIADRVLLGTRGHPVKRAELEEAQLILDALRVAVDRIDREFNLWAQCMTIKEIREPREAVYVDAVAIGDQTAAMAELQLDEDSVPRIAGGVVKKWWPLEPYELSWDGQSQKSIKPVNAFWCRPYPYPYPYHDSGAAGVWSGESIFFFPHCYLGPAIEWHDGKPEEPEKDELWVDIGTDPEPFVQFDEMSREYRVYLRDPKTSEEQYAGDEFDWGMSQAMTLAGRWLIIYPDPEAKRLMPALFSRGEFASTGLLPLSSRLIAEFGDSEHWGYVGRDGAPTLLQRLKDLTGFVTGDFAMMDKWRETAERFHLNPIFRSTHPSESENIIYRRHLEKWIAEHQLPMGGHEDE